MRTDSPTPLTLLHAWRDVIMAAEYRLGGRNFDGSSRYQRIYDFNRPIEEASVNLRGSMVEINPYKDDLFRKVIEQRKLHKADKALYYWLKILANSIYGFFVELIPEVQNKNVPVNVFSGTSPLLLKLAIGNDGGTTQVTPED